MAYDWYTSGGGLLGGAGGDVLGPLQGLLAAFGPNKDDKNQALKMSLMAMGAGMMGARKGQQWGQMGNAMQNALATYQNTLGNAARSKSDAMNAASNAIQLRTQLQGLEDDRATRDVMRNFYGGGQQPTNIDLAGGGPPSPMLPTASAASPSAGAPAPTGGNPMGKYSQYMRVAEQLYAKGAIKSAQEMEKKAKDFLPKLKEQKTLTQNGKRVTVNIYDDGTYQVLPDVQPDQEKLHFSDNGQFAGIGQDPFTGQVMGGGIPKQMTPGEVASNTVAQGNLKVAQGNLGVNQARFGLEQRKFNEERAGGGKPQMVNGQWVYPPDAANPTGRAVTPTGISNEGKPLTESQAKATAFANQMANASQTIATLEGGGFTGQSGKQQADILMAGQTGILGPAYRYMSSADAQRYNQAELQWTEGALRFMTGANAPEAEVVRNAATYFPRPGDTPGVIAQKAQARRNMEQSVRLAAASGNNQLPALPAETAPQGKTIVRTGTEKGTGRKVVQYSDGTKAYQ